MKKQNTNLEEILYTEDIDYIDGEILFGIKVKDEFLIGRYSTDIYIHGRCHLFALVAQEITGKPLHIFCKPDYHATPKKGDLSTGILLSHAYIDLGNGYSFDAKGTSKTETLKETFTAFEENIYELAEVYLDTITNQEENTARLHAMMKRGYIANFSLGEEAALKKHITEMIKLGCDKVYPEDSEIIDKIDNKNHPPAANTFRHQP